MHIDARTANLLGAWSLHVTDVMRHATEGTAGHGGGIPPALVALAADAGQSIEELRRTLRLTHPGTVRLVDRLVDQGWAERRRAAHGRAVAVVLTAAGRRTAAKIIAARQRALIGLLDPLSDGQRRALTALLEVLLAASTADTEDLRRRCRLCDRRCCQNCPVDLALDGR